MDLAALAFGRGTGRQVGGERRRGGLGPLEVGHRAIRLGLRGRPPRGCLPEPGPRLVPADLGPGQQRGDVLRGDIGAGRLLLRLGGEAARLRSELGEDVVDPGDVRLGLDELLLGLPPAPLVAAHAGDLLE